MIAVVSAEVRLRENLRKIEALFVGLGICRRRRCRNGRGRYSIQVEGAKYGASFGAALAIAISYTANHSILWAIIHGVLSWLYVIYFALFLA